MKRGYAIFGLLLLVLLTAPLRGAEKTCEGCHTPPAALEKIFAKHHIGTPAADRQCYGCHYYLVHDKPIAGVEIMVQKVIAEPMKQKKTYLNVRPLHFIVATKDRQKLTKYTRGGLKSFLEAPVSRYPFQAETSMFRMQAPALEAFLEEHKAELDATPRPALVPDLFKRGEELFQKNCVNCHRREGPGPLLRIGKNLLTMDYVKAALEGRLPQLEGRMPQFPQLGEQDITSLYHYFSMSDADLIKVERQFMATELHLPQEIYPKVIVPLLSKSCRHCHSNSASAQKNFQDFFQTTHDIKFLLTRTQLGYEPTAESFRFLLPQSNSCESSKLLQQFEARRAEWRGHYDPAVRGMPLTMKAIDPATTRAFRDWLRTGCHVHGESRCKPCLAH